MELVDIKAKTRGKNTREVTYKGIGKFVSEDTGEKDKDGNPILDTHLVTDGVCTTPKEALDACGGDVQKMLDCFAVGFNLEAYKAVSDLLAEHINPEWPAVKTAAFRLAVNNLMKLGNVSLERAVTAAKALMG